MFPERIVPVIIAKNVGVSVTTFRNVHWKTEHSEIDAQQTFDS